MCTPGLATEPNGRLGETDQQTNNLEKRLEDGERQVWERSERLYPYINMYLPRITDLSSTCIYPTMYE